MTAYKQTELCVFIVLFAVLRRVEKVAALAAVEVLLKSELKDVRQARAFSTQSFARADRAFMLLFLWTVQPGVM